jgi:hypothetical protein
MDKVHNKRLMDENRKIGGLEKGDEEKTLWKKI